jgi:parvulin-like peptidyl-prolyl isomerase
MTAPKSNLFTVFSLLLIILILSACASPTAGPVLPTITPTLPPTPTETPIPPALTINGEEVSQAEFDAELARYQAAQTALGKAVNPQDAGRAVRDNLIATLLLAQGAAGYKYSLEDGTLQARLDALAEQVGGPAALTAWESAHGYTDASFRQDLRRQIAAAWMRDQILASVPTIAEQVHVKQILLYNSSEAQSVLTQLQSGADFDTLAARYDPQAQGELGWFPHGYLSETALEQAAFALQPGQYSAVIQTQLGYHILMVEERDPARPLSPDALLTLQEHAVQDWLLQRQKESTITPAP